MEFTIIFDSLDYFIVKKNVWENIVAHFKSSAIHSVKTNKCKPSNFSEGNLVTVLTKRKAERQH